jgi:hypothetical protein
MKRAFFALTLATLLLTACGAAATPAPAFYAEKGTGGGAPVTSNSAPVMQAPAAPGVSDNANTTVDVASSAVNQQRLVIQNADLALVVAEPQAKMAEIGKLANDLGGFVVSSNLSEIYTQNGARVPQANITVRIPAAKLEDALAQIKTGVIEIQSENRSGQDVTDQYVDLQSRLTARQAAEEQLLVMLKQSQNAEDTLAIFNQLTQIQSDIEVLKGQIKYYEDAAALSAISVRLIAEESIQPIEIAGWKPQGVARDAAQALINFFQGFANFVIWLIIFIIPVAAVIIVMLALLWRLLRWFWRKVFPKKTPPPASTPVG